MAKGDLVEYYRRVAPVILPHIAEHPLTLHRFPDGIDGPHWYETRAPAHPSWLPTQHMYSFRSGKNVHAPLVNDLPALVWAANAAAIELHPFLATTADLRRPTALVFDLDPGEGVGLVEVCDVALRLRHVLDDVRVAGFPKMSGGSGLHVYLPIDGQSFDATKNFAREVAGLLRDADPARVTDVMAKRERVGKVFVDWSQNDAGKSTIAPYSLRGLPYPTVSMPVTWMEIDRAVRSRDARHLVFVADDVPPRLDHHGDLFAPLT
jgi:bifunctional non-homologous end joining protein LigD